MLNKSIKYFLFVFLIAISFPLLSKLFQENYFVEIEDVDFVAGLGYDLDTSLDKKFYSLPVLIYDYDKSGNTSSHIVDSKGQTPVEARINRQFHSGRKFVLGSEKVYLFSNKISKDGISIQLDGLLNNPQASPSALFITTSNDPKDVLSMKIEGYPTAPDYMSGLIKSLGAYSFFPHNQTISTAFKENCTEGCKFIAPNIDIVSNKLELTSMSVFDKGKMVASIPPKYMKYINTLRSSSGRGIATISYDDKRFISFTVLFNRKIKCNKNIDGTFRFDIDVKFRGQISNNSYYNNLIFSPSQKKIMEERISNYIKSNLTDFINIMRTEYKMDLLNLGYVAATKYGRNKIENWDTEILNSTINVNVDFTITKLGIGHVNFD